MSLEQALAANTAAITELIGAWKTLTANAVAAKNNENGLKAAGVTIIEKAADPKPVPTPVAAEVVTTVQAEPVAASPSEITYDQVSKAVLTKMKTDKPAVMAAAAKFGVKNAKELKPEQWADFIKEIA